MELQAIVVVTLSLLALLVLVAIIVCWQMHLRSTFRRTYEFRIQTDNAIAAAKWRESDPKNQFMVIDKTFRPSGLIGPSIRIQRGYHRNK